MWRTCKLVPRSMLHYLPILSLILSFIPVIVINSLATYTLEEHDNTINVAINATFSTASANIRTRYTLYIDGPGNYTIPLLLLPNHYEYLSDVYSSIKVEELSLNNRSIDLAYARYMITSYNGLEVIALNIYVEQQGILSITYHYTTQFTTKVCNGMLYEVTPVVSGFPLLLGAQPNSIIHYTIYVEGGEEYVLLLGETIIYNGSDTIIRESFGEDELVQPLYIGRERKCTPVKLYNPKADAVIADDKVLVLIEGDLPNPAAKLVLAEYDIEGKALNVYINACMPEGIIAIQVITHVSQVYKIPLHGNTSIEQVNIYVNDEKVYSGPIANITSSRFKDLLDIVGELGNTCITGAEELSQTMGSNEEKDGEQQVYNEVSVNRTSTGGGVGNGSYTSLYSAEHSEEKLYSAQGHALDYLGNIAIALLIAVIVGFIVHMLLKKI